MEIVYLQHNNCESTDVVETQTGISEGLLSIALLTEKFIKKVARTIIRQNIIIKYTMNP